MATFPRPWNCLVDYYDVAPPYCDGSLPLFEGIQVRQLKDYYAYEDSDNTDFHKRPLVRWCFEYYPDLWADSELPSTDDPFPGYFQIQGSPFQSNAYQIVGLEVIMTTGDPTTVDYLYAILRQVNATTDPCPPPPGPIPIAGGEDYTESVVIVTDETYQVTFIEGQPEQWFHIEAGDPSLLFLASNLKTSGAGDYEVNVFTSDPPLVPDATMNSAAALSYNNPSGAKTYIQYLSTAPGTYVSTYTVTPAPTSLVAGTLSYSTAPTILPNVLYDQTFGAYGEALWYKIDDSAALETFRAMVVNLAATTLCFVELFWNQPVPSVSDTNWNNDDLEQGTFGATPLYLRITNLDAGAATLRFTIGQP